jgi:hypothetical protein
MALVRSGSYGHRIAKISNAEYLVSWSTDTKPSGCRYRMVKRSSRYTDKAGAERFCKRWKISMPEEQDKT